MRKLTLIALIILLLLASFNYCKPQKKQNEKYKLSNKLNQNELNKNSKKDGFRKGLPKNLNYVRSFHYLNDTVFCKTGNLLIFYDKINDKWKYSAKLKEYWHKFEKRTITSQEIDYFKKFEIGCCKFITSVKDSWILYSIESEGSTYGGAELYDTLSGTSVYIPCEPISDFLAVDTLVWIGSKNGISKIDLSNGEFYTYRMLPAISETIGTFQFSKRYFIVDKLFGLFEYEYKTGELDGLTVDLNLEFTNAFRLDSTLYIIAIERNIMDNHLGGNSVIFNYNLKTNEIEKKILSIPYFNKLTKTDSSAFLYGFIREGYEGGDYVDYGGLIMFDHKNDTIRVLSKEPIHTLKLIDSGLITEQIIIGEYLPTVSYKKELFKNDSMLAKVLEVKNLIKSEGARLIGDTVKMGSTLYIVNDSIYNLGLRLYKRNISNFNRNYDFSTDSLTYVFGQNKVKRNCELIIDQNQQEQLK